MSIHLPLLPFETLRPSWSKPGSYAVMHHEEGIVAPREASLSGVKVGMRAGGVSAISLDTEMLQRSLAREQLALDAIAMALLQFESRAAVLRGLSDGHHHILNRRFIELYSSA